MVSKLVFYAQSTGAAISVYIYWEWSLIFFLFCYQFIHVFLLYFILLTAIIFNPLLLECVFIKLFNSVGVSQ